MEEHVGQLWHRLVSRAAEQRFEHARVHLAEVEKPLGVFLRTLAGDPGLGVTLADAYHHGARRNWLQRIAGSGQKVSLAWRDDSFLHLPESLDALPRKQDNRDLYFWLAALGAHQPADSGDWMQASQAAVCACLRAYPGLRPRYDRLAQAHLALRPDAAQLPAAEAAAERAIRAALAAPGTVAALPAARLPVAPVLLWLHPQPPLQAAARRADRDPALAPSSKRDKQRLRRRAEQVEAPEADRGLVTIRMENILTWGEFVRVDRGTEDEDDLKRAEDAARDLDVLSVSRGGAPAASSLRFDLDLPSAAFDDTPCGPGVRLPEWDWRHKILHPQHCRIEPLLATRAEPRPLPSRLRPLARRLRRQFEAVTPARTWHRKQADGEEIDLDACVRYATDRAAGSAVNAERLYQQRRSGARDLQCLLMADLSLSTDTWVDDHQRVIDVVRDSLYLFGESLQAAGDPFALYGFSSRRRDPVRVHRIKSFDEPYDALVRGRIDAIKPGYYTRMGAALRYGGMLLQSRAGGRQLLLMLTDGKPNDLDQYEGRYGIEDTRHAVREIRRQGMTPFCVTIDEDGNDYLPYLFGKSGYVVIRSPTELPRRLPALYAQLTA